MEIYLIIGSIILVVGLILAFREYRQTTSKESHNITFTPRGENKNNNSYDQYSCKPPSQKPKVEHGRNLKLHRRQPKRYSKKRKNPKGHYEIFDTELMEWVMWYVAIECALSELPESEYHEPTGSYLVSVEPEPESSYKDYEPLEETRSSPSYSSGSSSYESSDSGGGGSCDSGGDD